MLRERIIRKICFTTFIFFILLVVITFTNNEVIPNTKTEYKNDLVNIYLLDKNNYLTQVMVLVSDKNDYLTVEEIVENLKNKNKYYTDLNGIIPNNTKINKIELKDDIIYIDFNKELLNVNKELEEKVIESLVYSIMSLPNIKGIKISIDNKKLKVLPKSNIKLKDILTKEFGINKEYDLTSTNDVLKVVLYFYQEIDNNNYYVPVTKYVNNKEDKIKVIIDNLKNSYLYKTNLMSYLNDKIEVMEYERVNDVVTLSFNNLITLDPNGAQEEVIYTVSNSIFSSTDIKKIVFMEDEKIVMIKNNNYN